MQRKIKCCLVRDMLPLYIDGITSEKTNKEIRQHIDECAECRKIENAMRTDVISVEIDGLSDDIDGFKKINNNNKKKMELSIAMGICVISHLNTNPSTSHFMSHRGSSSRT